VWCGHGAAGDHDGSYASTITGATAVPACPSLPISVAVADDGLGAADPDRVLVDLLVALAQVTDPRAARGVRHKFVAVLAVGVGAVLGGARSYTAIAEWAHDLPVGVRVRLGLARLAPSESTIRRTLQAVDADDLDQTVSAWLATRSAPPSGSLSAGGSKVRVVALDGKSARGARGRDGRAVHLLAAFDHDSGVVLGQTIVDGKTNEISAFAPLLDRIDITGAIITADALHTQRAHAEYLHGRGAHYVLTVKRNQPGLHDQLASLPWAQVPEVDLTRDTGHGRVESRSLKLAAVSGIGFPHARLAIRLTRRRRSRTSGKFHTETVYAVTDLSWGEIRAEQLAQVIRRHWSIENRLHWIRDVVFDEDHSQIRTAAGPAVMATLRNLAISVHRLAGATNIAAACRRVGRHPNRVLPLLT
jgi:predicted transposase YbfD/YdcC